MKRRRPLTAKANELAVICATTARRRRRRRYRPTPAGRTEHNQLDFINRRVEAPESAAGRYYKRNNRYYSVRLGRASCLQTILR